MSGWALIKDNEGTAALLFSVAGLLVSIAYWDGRLDSSIRRLESGIDRKFQVQNELIETMIDAKFEAQNKLIAAKFDARFEAQDAMIEAKFQTQDESIATKFDLLSNRIDGQTEALDALKDVVATALAANPSGTKPPAALASESPAKPSAQDVVAKGNPPPRP